MADQPEDGVEQKRLVQELVEALSAAGMYVGAVQRMLQTSDWRPPAKLLEALERGLAQLARADNIAKSLHGAAER